MKFNIQYVMRNWIMFAVIVVVFGVIFWFIGNRGSGGGSGGGTSYVSTGPSEMELAAQTRAPISLNILRSGAIWMR